MDLEAELRAAMSAHVADLDAPPALVAAVRARHRRRTARIRATVGTAALVAAGAAVWPAYHAVQATPAGADHVVSSSPSPHRGVPGPTGGVTTKPTPTSPNTPQPRSTPPATSPPATHPAGTNHPGVSWVTYLPSRLKQAGPCRSTHVTGFPATTCEWTAGQDWLKVQVVRSPALLRPEQLGLEPLTARSTMVHSQPALATPGHLAWIERAGVGVIVTSDVPLDPQLPKIADGIHP